VGNESLRDGGMGGRVLVFMEGGRNAINCWRHLRNFSSQFTGFRLRDWHLTAGDKDIGHIAAIIPCEIHNTNQPFDFSNLHR